MSKQSWSGVSGTGLAIGAAIGLIFGLMLNNLVGEEGNTLVARMSLVGLLHDASEAYLKDMPSPIKAELPKYQAMEAKLMDVIMEKHNLLLLWKCEDMQYLIHKVDKAVMACEVRDLIKHRKVWSMPEKPYDDLTVVPVIPDTATVQFLARYSTLMRELEG